MPSGEGAPRGAAVPLPQVTQLREAMAPFEVDRISNPGPLSFLRRYVAQNQPVVLTDAVSGWPALEKWSDAKYLADTMGDAEVTVAVTPDGRADAVEPSTGVFMKPAEVRMTVAQLFAKLKEQNSKSTDEMVYYAQFQNDSLREQFPQLVDDVQLNIQQLGSCAFGVEPDAINLWLGSEQSSTSMHQDFYENMYVVLSGTKVFTLVPPWEKGLLHIQPYPQGHYKYDTTTGQICSLLDGPDADEVPWVSVNPVNPDYDKHPNFRSAHPVTVEVQAGEVLYLPAMWFHEVHQKNDATGKVVALNYWFDMQYNTMFHLTNAVADSN